MTNLPTTCAVYEASPHYGHILLEGPDTAAFLHRLTSNDVTSLAVQSGQYNSLLTHKGKVLSLFYVYRETPEKFLVVVGEDILEKTLTLITKMKFREKITIQNISAERGLIFLLGAEASAEASKITHSGAIKMTEPFGEISCVMVSYPSAANAEVAASISSLPRLSDEDFELLRVRNKFPRYGIDIDENTILLESTVPVAHKRFKGCYPGQEVIERISSYGKGRAPKTLCLLSMEGNKNIPKDTSVLQSEGVVAGKTTSSIFDATADKTWVLGYLEQKFINPENSFQIESQPASLVS